MSNRLWRQSARITVFKTFSTALLSYQSRLGNSRSSQSRSTIDIPSNGNLPPAPSPAPADTPAWTLVSTVPDLAASFENRLTDVQSHLWSSTFFIPPPTRWTRTNLCLELSSDIENPSPPETLLPLDPSISPSPPGSLELLRVRLFWLHVSTC